MNKALKYTAIISGLLGLGTLLSSIVVDYDPSLHILEIGLGGMTIGGLGYFISQYHGKIPGIKNNHVWRNSLTNKGAWGLFIGIIITAFYVCIYWYPEYLGFSASGKSSGLVALFDPLSYLVNGKPASQWFVYGSLYTFAILLFGIKFIYKYRNNRYQIIRTISVMFFQFAFAYYIPELLSVLNPETPYFAKDLKYMWPLNYYFLDQWHLKNMINGGNLGLFFLLFGLALIFVISPVLTFFFGKRWYCSWVCGCGALAETAGDPFRQLSSKRINIWKLERWMVHAVLVFIVLTTIAVVWSFLTRNPDISIITRNQFAFSSAGFLILVIATIIFWKRNGFSRDVKYIIASLGIIIIGIISINVFSNEKHILFVPSNELQSTYGFIIGAAFSGVLGVGFYPLFGSRVWCRFGCPMAAILGLQQRLFSRFRITTNGGQCISCGNCSVYCEMGIDVRAYAQRGENIIRSSCVGCGICSAVCPRGVLKLENKALKNRINQVEFPLGNNLNKD